MNISCLSASEEKRIKIEDIKNLFTVDRVDDYYLLNNKVLAFTGLNKTLPIMIHILNNSQLAKSLELFNCDLLISYAEKDIKIYNKNHEEIFIDGDLKNHLLKIVEIIKDYGGHLDEFGNHIINLKTPFVGTHYGVNLLIGDRSKFSHPLQSTPKSVVDYFGRGSFRAHSSFQVLATAWGLSPEENGHPSNRQFYLVEDGKQIFYSAHIDEHVLKATCKHSQNHTIIEYELDNGLIIKRTIFISRQFKGLPCANEVQMIAISNKSNKDRRIKIVYTGMFGSSNPDTQKVDVIYSTLITETRVLTTQNNEIFAITPAYYPEYCRREIRYCILKDEQGYAEEFSSSYADFLGNGTLFNPENLLNLDNKLSKRGPNFFALAKDVTIEKGKTHFFDTFTGMVDAKDTKGNDDYNLLVEELNALVSRFNSHKHLERELKGIINDYQNYAKFLQISNNSNELMAKYVNNNLPFQVYYQTFISRAFAMTQKGYREIGFREIQDIYASMYYFVAEHKEKLVKDMLLEWVGNVYKMGYANHNFYYVGKEPGICSDDQLWLVQAVYRYINLTNDVEFLNYRVKMAGSANKRSIYDTLKSIVLYSGEISIGKHGLPVLDSADWNDCLNIDSNYLNGPKKEKAYKSQLKRNNQKFGVPFENCFSESVMNAFLLVIAYDNVEKMAILKKDFEYAKEILDKKNKLEKLIQEHAYVRGYFARVLVNNQNKYGIKYIGVEGDCLSLDENISGSYYLNSFTWSLLSNVANEKQISEMLDKVEKYLKTPAGFKLCTKHNLALTGAKGSATDQYKMGDRENGGVFKHATMMLVVALLRKSKEVSNIELKKRLLNNAYFMLDVVMPYRTLENPYKFKGNPRFCTQYNNSISEENIGPILSGTSSWLTLAILEALGIEMLSDGFTINPALKEEDTEMNYSIKFLNDDIDILIKKPNGKLCNEKDLTIYLDGQKVNSNYFHHFNDNAKHRIELIYC